jgi:hypothetical protein
MLPKAMTRLAFCSCLPLLLLVGMRAASAQSTGSSESEHQALLGTWDMTSEVDGGDPVKWVLILRDQDGKLQGLLTTDGGEQPAKDFALADHTIHFKAPYQGEEYLIELKLDGAHLSGTWSGDGNSGNTTGVKRP